MSTVGSAAGIPKADAPLPSLNIVVSRLLALYARADYTPAEVIALVETDPAIAARLLRLANSAYYGFESRVNTLQRAVVLLGGITVQAVALGADVLAVWGRQAPPATVAALWIDAYLCAKGCRFLGQRLAPQPYRSPPDTLFLTGLLHRIGRLWFLAQKPLEYAALLEQGAPASAVAVQEREWFGWDCATAGGALLEAWHLPPAIAATVRHQHHDQLRAELRPDWAVLVAAAPDMPLPAALDIPTALLDDLAQSGERDRPEAEAFYAAIA